MGAPSLLCSLLGWALCVTPALALDAGDIVVTALKGEVHVTMNGGERAVRAGSVLELPATVMTGRDGAIDLRQGATTISVGPGSQLDFPALEIPGGPIDRIQQPRGNAFYDVGKRGGRKLRIETPFLVAVVKGTQFNVAAREDATTISLFEGRLEIRSGDDGDLVDLVAGEIAFRHRNDQDIGVIKMDAPKPTPAPAAPAGAEGGDRGAAPPAAPRPQPVDEGEQFLVDAGSEPGSLVDVRIDLGATDTVTLAALAVPEPPIGPADLPMDAEVETESGTGAGPGAGAGVVDVPVGVPEIPVVVEVPVSAPEVPDVVAEVGGEVTGGPGGGNADGGVSVDIGVGAGGGVVDAGTSVDVDLGIDLDDDDDGNSGHGNSNGYDEDNPGNGNSNGRGKRDDTGLLGNIVEDVTNLLDDLRKPGKK